MVEHDLTLAVDKGERPSAPSVVVRVGDVGTQTVTARLTRDSQPYSPTSMSARLEVLKADGTWCRCDAELSGDTLTCVLPSQALSSPGLAQLAYFVLFSGDDAESTESFGLRVLPHVDSSGPESENYDDQLTRLHDEYVERLGGLDAQYEQAEDQRDSRYAAAESARDASFRQAEATRDSAQSANDAAQQANDAAQAKNDADQAANNAAAQGLTAVVLGEGEYDPSTLEPTVEGAAGRMYLAPLPQARAAAMALPMRFALAPNDDGSYAATASEAAGGDTYVEWLWIGSAWERIGLSTATIDPVTTDQVDAVAAGGSPQGKQVLSLTGLSYLWARLRGAFAALAHRHAASDIASGTLAVERGGTGASSASAALASLGAAPASELREVRDDVARFTVADRTEHVSFYTWDASDGTVGMQIVLRDSSGVLADVVCSTKDGVRFRNRPA